MWTIFQNKITPSERRFLLFFVVQHESSALSAQNVASGSLLYTRIVTFATARWRLNVNKSTTPTKVLWVCCRPNLIWIMLLHLPESELIAGVPVPGFLHVNEDRTWVCVNCWGNKLTFVWKTSWGRQFPPWIPLTLYILHHYRRTLLNFNQRYLLSFRSHCSLWEHPADWQQFLGLFLLLLFRLCFLGFFWVKPFLQNNI